MEIEQPRTIDILDNQTVAPALSSTSDVPVVETKPDATPVEQEAEAAPEEGTTTSESATEPDEPSANDEPKKAKGVQKRLDELTRQREEAERRAQETAARLDKALSMLEKLTGNEEQIQQATQQPQAADAAPVRPNKAEYADPDQYEQALDAYFEQRAEWTARRTVREAQEQAEQARIAAEVEKQKQAAQEAYSQRIKSVADKYADFHEVAESPDVHVSIPMAAAILHSENGPELQYYLGKNPAEAQRLMQLSPPLQLIELGKIEARLTATAPEPAAKPSVSKAPTPIRPIGSGNAGTSKDPSEMSTEEYRKWRQSQASARH